MLVMLRTKSLRLKSHWCVTFLYYMVIRTRDIRMRLRNKCFIFNRVVSHYCCIYCVYCVQIFKPCLSQICFRRMVSLAEVTVESTENNGQWIDDYLLLHILWFDPRGIAEKRAHYSFTILALCLVHGHRFKSQSCVT